MFPFSFCFKPENPSSVEENNDTQTQREAKKAQVHKGQVQNT